MIMTQDFIDEIANATMNLISHAAFVVDGNTQTVDLDEISVDGDEITIKFFIDNTVVGTITSYQVIGKSGKVLLNMPDSIEKPVNKGILVMFKFTIKEV